MLFNQRIIWEDGSTLRDLSRELNDAASGTAVISLDATPTDYIYIGSDLPFNHRCFTIGVANAIASVIDEIEIWDGNAWTPAVDVIDQTEVGGKTWAQSGIISWVLDRNANWHQESTTEDMTGSGLTTLKIYDMFWIRMSVTAPITTTASLAYVGFRFAKDADLGGYYPDLVRSSVMDAHTSGKTNWDIQHAYAAEEIIRELRKARICWNPNQLFNWEQFNQAAIHKVAEIIFSGFGDAYEEQRKVAMEKYKREVNQGVFVVDRNESGRIEERERRPFTGLTRG